MTNENTKLEYRNFEEAKEFVRSLNLNSTKEWQEYCKTKISLKLEDRFKNMNQKED